LRYEADFTNILLAAFEPVDFRYFFDIKVREGVSNTRPARCVCAARDIINITQIIAETTVFCSINALLASYCDPRRHFFLLMRPAYETEFETPGLGHVALNLSINSSSVY